MSLDTILADFKQGLGILNDPTKSAAAAGAVGGALSFKVQSLETRFQNYFGVLQKKLQPLWPGGAEALGNVAGSITPSAPSSGMGISGYLLAGAIILLALVLVVKR